MRNYKLSRKAINDLSDIWNYTYENWSELQADKYYQHLLETFEYLCSHPKIGRKYTEIIDNLLGFSIHKHIIFYRINQNNEIEILRVLHQSMDLKRKMTK